MVSEPENSFIDAEVYEAVGRAMHAAQLFELSIKGLAAQLQLATDSTSGTFDDDEHFDRVAKALGRTIGQIQHHYELPDAIVDQVEEARVTRNHIAHEFFFAYGRATAEARARAAPDDVIDTTRAVRSEALEFLRASVTDFDALSATVDEIALDLVGMTREELDKAIADAAPLVDELLRGDPPDEPRR